MDQLQTAPVRRYPAWHWVIAIALAAALLYKSLQGVAWPGVWSAILGARWQYLAAGSLTSLLSYWLRALRWRILLNAGAAEALSLRAVFQANMAGYLGSAVLPARAGEVIRSLIVSGQSSLSRAYVLTTALGERVWDAGVLVVCGSLALLYVPSKPAWIENMARGMALAAGAGFLFLVALPHAEPLACRIIARLPLPAALKKRALALLDQVLLALRALYHTRRFLNFAGLTAVIWTLDALGLMVSARGLDIHMPFVAAVLLLAAMGLGSALPATPGYVGIYQFVTVTALAPFGIPRSAALAYSLVTQALVYVVIVALGAPGLYWFLAPGRKSLKARH